MPSPYARDVARLKAEIVARVAAGASLRGLAAVEGAPCAHTVRTWAKADAGFAAALAAARAAWGARDRVEPYDEAWAGAFLARARAGETVNALLGAAEMPTRATYRYWQATQATFAEAVFDLRRRRDADLGARGRARLRAFDPVVADRVIVALHRGAQAGLRLEAVLADDPVLPSRPTLRRWRREAPVFDRVLRMIFAGRRRMARPVPEVLADEIVDHIAAGGSFASFSRMAGGPSRTTLRRWHRADPGFADAVAAACEWREDWYAEHIVEAALHTPPGPLRAMERSIGPLKRQIVRLRHRPGAVHRRPGGSGEAGGETL